MNAQLLEDAQQLRDLEPAWAELYRRCAHAAPFQHPAWLLPWWDCFGSGRLFSVAVWDGDRLVGLMPAFLHEWKGRRQITFAGNGPSDYMDALAEPELREDVARAALAEFSKHCDEWDVADLENVLADSPLAMEGVAGEMCGVVNLPPRLPHGLRRNLRRYREKMEMAGEVEWVNARSNEEFERLIGALFELHAARWRSRGEAGMLGGGMERFHREAAMGLWRAGIARCYGLLFEGSVAVVIYGFMDKGRFWSYQSGFDPKLSAFSPGALILEYAMQQAIDSGCLVFDFLRGSEEYKRDWGAEFRPNRHVILESMHSVPVASHEAV